MLRLLLSRTFCKVSDCTLFGVTAVAKTLLCVFSSPCFGGVGNPWRKALAFAVRRRGGVQLFRPPKGGFPSQAVGRRAENDNNDEENVLLCVSRRGEC